MNSKLFTVFIIVLCLTTSLWSQSSSNSVTAITENAGAIRNALIKEYMNLHTIRCNVIDTTTPALRSSFSYQNWTTLQETTILLNGYIVKDFVISNDSVFFCGYDTEKNGIIGFFNIQDLFWGAGTFYIQNDFLAYPYDTARVGMLHKMVSYTNSIGERHIVCIGRTKEKWGMSMSCLIDMHTNVVPDNGRSPSPWSYITGTLFKSTPSWLLDIVQTEKWLVTAGFEESPHISLRTYSIDDVLAYGGPQDESLIYNVFPPSYNYPKSWNNDEVLLAVLTNDTIATAATWMDTTFGIKKARQINIAQYRLSQVSGLLSTTMLSLRDLYISHYPNEVGLRGFIGNSINRRMALLFEGTTPESDTNSIFIEMNQNATIFRGNTNFVYASSSNRDMGLGGLSLYNNGSQYIMAGRCKWARYIHTYEKETSWSQSLCQEDIGFRYTSVPPVSSNIMQSPFIHFAGIGNLQPILGVQSEYHQITIKCER